MIGTSRLLSVKTVQTKFLIISIPILLLSIAVLFTLFELNAQHQATLKLHDKLDRLLVTQSAAMMTPVWNVADDQVKLMLDALAIDPDIRGAFVTDDADSLLGQVGLVAVGEFNAERDIVQVQGGERKVIGRIAITLTDKRLQAETKIRLLLVGVLAVLLVLSVVASQLVAHRQTIGVPIERLLKAIKTSAHGGRRDPVQWKGRDEMATVVSAFNEMQVRQEAYEADLRNARDTLEQRVEDRTAELTKNQEELVEKEKALSDQLKFTEAMIDTIPNPMWVKDTDARYVMSNRAHIKATGIRREDRIGKTVMEMEHLPLELRTRLRQEAMDLLRTGGTYHNEQIRRWADGTDHNILYWETAFFLADGDVAGLVGVQVDISEQKRAEKALRESEELFTTMLDHMPAPVYLRDLEGRFKLINREYGKVWGVTKDGVRGKTPHEVFPKQQADEFMVLDRAVLKERRVQQTEETYSLADGKHFLAVTKFPIFDLSGEVVGVGAVDVDITERKRAEEALEEAYEVIKTQKERMQGELDVGRDIQMSLVPQKFPAFPDREEFDLYATLQPAREVGGDLYDFYFLDKDRLCFCIGDVSGKGVPAALFMAMTKTLIKSRSVNDYSTASIVTHVNDELNEDNLQSMFVTLFLAILNVRTGELLYTNAGHNPSYTKRSSGSVEVLKELHGPIVGAMPGLTYKEASMRLKAGDMMLLYTDGVTEAMNKEDELYSDPRLDGLVERSSFESAQQLTEMVMADVVAFEDGNERADDITILALCFNGTSKSGSINQTVNNIQTEIS